MQKGESSDLIRNKRMATINVSTGDFSEISLLAAKSVIQKFRELLGSLNPFAGMVISSQAFA